MCLTFFHLLQLRSFRHEVRFIPPDGGSSVSASSPGSCEPPSAPSSVSFEHVFGEAASQEAVFAASIKPLIKLVTLGKWRRQEEILGAGEEDAS